MNQISTTKRGELHRHYRREWDQLTQQDKQVVKTQLGVLNGTAYAIRMTTNQLKREGQS